MEEVIDIKAFFTSITGQIRKSLVLIVVIFAVSIGSGFTLFTFQKKVYTAHAEVYNNSILGSTIDQVVRTLNTVIESRDVESVAKMLQIDEDVTSTLVGVSGTFNDKNEQVFGLDIQVTDEKNVKKIESALLDFMNNNQLLFKLTELKKERYNNTIEFIDLERDKINSVISNYRNVSENLGDLVEALLLLKDKRDSYQYNISMLETSYQYFQTFTSPELVVNMRSYLLGSITIAMFLSVALVLVRISL